MANNPLPVARSKISIGGATAVFDQATVAADTYTPIGGVRTVPGFGDTYQDITVEEVGDGRTRHGKGTASGSQMEIVCSRRSADAGQIAMKAAADDIDQSYNLKFEIPNGRGGNDIYYITALVMSKPVGMGGPNDTQTITFQCQPQEAPIEVLGA